MVRIAYFGTDGCPGHHVIPIRGKFTEEKESGFNFLHNPNNGRMQSGRVKIDEIGLFKQIIE